MQKLSRKKAMVSAWLILSLFINTCSGMTFAETPESKQEIQQWTFNTKETSLYWSDSHARWELKLTPQTMISTMDSDEAWLPTDIFVSVGGMETATPSNAKKTVVKVRNQKMTESNTFDNTRDEDTADDRENADLTNDVISDSDNENNNSVETDKIIIESKKNKMSGSDAILGNGIKVPITWNLDPFYDFLQSYLSEHEVGSESESADIDTESVKEEQKADGTDHAKTMKTENQTDEDQKEENTDVKQTEVMTFPETEYTIYAIPDDGYYLSSLADPVALTVVLTSNDSIPDDVQDANRIDTVSPDGLTLNVFDYWNTTQDAADFYGWGSYNNEREWKTDFWNKNIGKDHVLQFLGAENNAKFGAWNSWVGNSKSSYPGIVQKKLVNGYPALNITKEEVDATSELAGRDGNESLEYLFNPDMTHDGKESFSNVKGLLASNGAGVSYSCKTNFAELVRTPNDGESDAYFRVYNIPGIRSNWNVMGQFFPFASVNQVFTNDNETLKANEINCQKFTHFHGMSGSMNFTKKSRGVVRYNNTSSNLHFTFSGNDSMWVYVDGVLVGDGGGNSDEKVVSINFATGAVEVRRASGNTSDSTQKTTIRECFEAAGDSVEGFTDDTFADGTEHTLQFFFLERGSNASFLSLDFNTLDLDAIDRETLAKNRIQTISPENIHINLHDYWTTGKYDQDYYKSAPAEEASGFWKNGIGKDHLLQFANTVLSLNRDGDTKDGFGKFNEWTRNQGIAYEGIVKPLLKNGYPEFNISEKQIETAKLLTNTECTRNESLAYLFDPDYEQDGKESYRNVNGLLKEENDFTRMTVTIILQNLLRPMSKTGVLMYIMFPRSKITREIWGSSFH